MKKIIGILIICLISYSLIFSNGEKEKDGNLKIGVSIMELTAYTWYLGVEYGCDKWAKDNPDAGFTFQFVDSRSDVSTMLNNIETLITWGAKGIILFPADASSAIPVMKQYVSKGIPFVIGDYEQLPKNKDDVVWSTFVGHNMRALGEKVGSVAVNYLKKANIKDPVCVFVSRPTDGQSSVDRYQGFRDTIRASFPSARVIEEGDIAAGSRDSSQSLMENVLQREKRIDVVSGHNDAEVLGAYNAAVAANRKEIKFIGIAGDKDVLAYITNGNKMWLGEILQNPVDLGYQATQAMYDVYVLKKKIPKVWDLPEPETIIPENIKEYNWQTWPWL